MELTREYLLWLFHYDRENGKLYWKNPSKNNKHLIFSEAGYLIKSFSVKGVDKFYRYIKIAGKAKPVHRLVIMIESGFYPPMIDHVNGDTLDNRFLNLKIVSNRNNQQNQYRHRKGKLVGVSWHKMSSKWRASIKIKGKAIHLGSFSTELEAHQRYMQELIVRGLA